MKSFKEKVVVITGAGSGIGKALAMNFAKRGANLAISDINEENLNKTASDIRSLGRKVYTKSFDVSKNNQFLEFAEEVKQNLGAADVVVNNAGVALGKMTIEETTIEQMEWLMGINFWGMVYGTKAFLPQMHKTDTTAIINISSLFGLVGIAFQGSYCASKFGIRGFNEVLIAEMLGKNIQVHTVHPGGIKTNVNKNAVGGDPRYSKAFEKILTMPPEKAAEIIVSGVVRNKKRILIGMDAKIPDFGARLWPITLVNFFQKKIVDRMERKFSQEG